jgi:hypothetical protein|tara:strand:+ start:2022 stop:2726 length:705 start_codon:yes stop_codon:yes gene_type:complete
MSRYIRTAGTSGGGAGYTDSNVCSLLQGGVPSAMGVCCIRTEWETLFQCEGGDGTSFGCCIEFTVDATKYRGFRLHMNGFCTSTCMNCQVYFGVGSASCYCCCNYTSFYRCTSTSGHQSYQNACNNAIFGGSNITGTWCYGTRIETEIMSTAACSRNWRGYQRIFDGNTQCYNEMISVTNLTCGIIWCDITRLKYVVFTNQNIISMPGAYLAVFGLKAPTCSIAFNATKSEAQT